MVAKPSHIFGRNSISAPDAEAGVHALISQFGREAVETGYKKALKPRMGRSAVDDTTELFEFFKQDAADILAGGNPSKIRSNRALAKQISAVKPGHSRESTQRRIMGKLAKHRIQSSHYYAAMMAKEGGHG